MNLNTSKFIVHVYFQNKEACIDFIKAHNECMRKMGFKTPKYKLIKEFMIQRLFNVEHDFALPKMLFLVLRIMA